VKPDSGRQANARLKIRPAAKPQKASDDIVIVDHGPLVRASLIMILGGASDSRVIAEAGDRAEALDHSQRHAPQAAD
jgi:hypothetical protein